MTHEAVNLGGRAFGNWLLTLRGGLCHTLAETARSSVRSKDRTRLSARQARRRRVLLALSWLSVESRRGAPLEYAVPSDAAGKPRTLAALADILHKRGLSQPVIDEWLEDCRPALDADVRSDAVWINRSAMFDALAADQNPKAARDDCRHVLWYLFTDQYLVLPLQAGKSADGKPVKGPAAPATLADQPAMRASSSGAGQRTRHLFSHLFGTSATFGTQSEKLRLCAFWRQHLTAEIARSGMPLDEVAKRGRKRLDDVQRSPSEFHREMFAKSATRLAQIVTKIRRQEASRLHWAEADQKLHQLEVQFPVALRCFEQYRQNNPSEPIGTEALYSCREWLQRSAHARPLAARKTDGIAGIAGGGDAGRANANGGVAVAPPADQQFGEGQDDPADGEAPDPVRYKEFNVFWFSGGSASREKLKAYSEGTAARSGVSLLKAVSYRHPDAYFSPIFCQFGVSRPQVDFERLVRRPPGQAGSSIDHRGVSLLVWDGTQATLEPLRATSKRFDAEIGCADQAAAAQSAVGPAAASQAPRHDVARRTRLGAAAAGEVLGGEWAGGALRVAHVFDAAPIVVRRKTERKTPSPEEGKTRAPRWNGTLRADRAVLARLGRAAAGNPQRAARMIEKSLQWSLSVSLELVPHGPWIDYGNQHGLHDLKFESPSGERQIVTGVSNKNEQWRGLAFPFWHPANRAASRKGKAKQMLADLPDLRLLSVIPGHEHGAACAVWQTLSAAQFNLERERAIAHGGSAQVNPLWATVRVSHAGGSNAKSEAALRTVCYRRIGPDAREDGTAHAACWARLERQFVIKLPGEQDDCRRPTADELARVEQLERELNLAAEPASRSNVNRLMAHGLRLIAHGLNRHANLARIARAMVTAPAASSPAPADAAAVETNSEAIDELATAIGLWHAMAIANDWPDAWARKLWQKHIGHLPADGGLWKQADGGSVVSLPARLTRQQCEQIARQLSPLDRAVLHQQWATRWSADDGRPAQVHAKTAAAADREPASGWYARLRWIHDWVRGRKAGRAARAVGGLSLARLAVVHAACEQMRAFGRRPRPSYTASSQPGEIASRSAEVLQRKLDDRAKQLANRIVEAALGVADAAHARGTRPSAASCHAVVLGTLSSQELAPTLSGDERVVFGRATRQLRTRLTEACQLHGLHLTNFATRHASRQDARTGAPGIRYREVQRRAFVAADSAWAAQLAEVQRRVQAARQASRPAALADLYWLALHKTAQIKSANVADGAVPSTLRLPSQHGPLFMPVVVGSAAVGSAAAGSAAAGSAGRGVNFELNAAASLGVQPLLDADWPGSWWYVPTVAGRRTQRRADPGRAKGAACLERWQAEPTADGRYHAAGTAYDEAPVENYESDLRQRLLALLTLEPVADPRMAEAAGSGIEIAPATDPVRRKRGRPRKTTSLPRLQPEFMNLWRDVSPESLDQGAWRDYAHYNRHVVARGLMHLLDAARPGSWQRLPTPGGASRAMLEGTLSSGGAPADNSRVGSAQPSSRPRVARRSTNSQLSTGEHR